MNIILLLIVGAAAGFFSTRIMKIELDTITTIVVGMVGALLGGVLLQVAAGALGAMGGIIGAVLGTMLVLWLWQKVRGPGS